MLEIVIVYWRDIPAQVTVRHGRKKARRVLDPRFEKAIDAAAMRANARDTDAYLAEWRRGKPETIDGDNPDDTAQNTAQKIEQDYPDTRLKALVATHGREPDNTNPTEDST